MSRRSGVRGRRPALSETEGSEVGAKATVDRESQGQEKTAASAIMFAVEITEAFLISSLGRRILSQTLPTQMRDLDLRMVDDLPASLTNAQAEVVVLEIHEERLVEAADLLPNFTA